MLHSVYSWCMHTSGSGEKLDIHNFWVHTQSGEGKQKGWGRRLKFLCRRDEQPFRINGQFRKGKNITRVHHHACLSVSHIHPLRPILFMSLSSLFLYILTVCVFIALLMRRPTRQLTPSNLFLPREWLLLLPLLLTPTWKAASTSKRNILDRRFNCFPLWNTRHILPSAASLPAAANLVNGILLLPSCDQTHRCSKLCTGSCRSSSITRYNVSEI